MPGTIRAARMRGNVRETSGKLVGFGLFGGIKLPTEEENANLFAG